MNTEDKDQSLNVARQIDLICEEFEDAWKAGNRPQIEDFLQGMAESARSALLLELIGLDSDYRRKIGEQVSIDDYTSRFDMVPIERLHSLLDHTLSAQFDLQRGKKPVKLANEPPASRFIKYFGDYELLEEWARGGMGTVYRARQTSLNRIVAVKTINSGLVAGSDQVLRFTKEAKAAGGLRHRNIVPVYEVGQHDGVHFYSMAFVEGMSLGEKLSHGPLDQREAARLISTVADAIHYAHEQGIIHRDIKPTNILLEADGEPLVSDFGLAKQVTENSILTVSGDVLGTPSYMPPEQAAGQMDQVLIQSDVYSLGAVLYTCLSGRPPFQAATKLLTLQQVIENEPVQLRQLNSAVSRDLETIVHKCLDKSVTRRYPSALALKLDLDRYLRGEPILARPIGAMERAWRWCRRHPSRALNVIGVAVVLLGSLASWYALERRQQHRQKIAAVEALWNELRVCGSDQLPQVMGRIVAPSKNEQLLLERLKLGYASARNDLELRFRAGLALLEQDPTVVPDICEAWIYSTWQEWNWVRLQLDTYEEPIRQWLQQLDEAAISRLTERQTSRLAAIVASVSIDPSDTKLAPELRALLSDEERLVDSLITELQSDIGSVSDVAWAFRNRRQRFGEILANRIDHRLPDQNGHRPTSARLLAELFQHDARQLLQFSWSAHSDLMAILFGRGDEQENYAWMFQEIIALKAREELTWDERFELNRKQALAGAYLFALNRGGESLLELNADATARCLMIEWVPKLQRDPTKIVQRLIRSLQAREEHVDRVLSDPMAAAAVPNCWLADPDSARLRALIQILGNYPNSALRRMCGEEFWKLLVARFQRDPDPGLRSNCEWCLQIHAAHQLAKSQAVAAPAPADWYKVPNDHIMVSLRGPVEFVAGSAADDPYRDAGSDVDVISGETSTWSEDHRHPKKIARSFAIATAETTFGQLQQFNPDAHIRQNKSLAPQLNLPANRVTWADAARYCNWLSEQHDIPQEEYCFVIESDGSVHLADRYLHKRGFRLPTEAEWEYACRAGTSTRCYFGDAPELLDSYCWYYKNSQEQSLIAANTRKPNDLGLFQTLGNALEWTMDQFSVQHSQHRFRMEDAEFTQAGWSLMLLKGGSIFTLPRDIRASEFFSFQPSYREGNVGFRIAQTLESHDN